jgi:hypothetical protein
LLSLVAPTVAQQDVPTVAQQDVPAVAQQDVSAVAQQDVSAVAQQGVLQFRQQTLKAKELLDSLGNKVEIEPWANYAALSLQRKGLRVIEDSRGNKVEITEWDNGIFRSKYLVAIPGVQGGWIWYTQSGSANAGKGETGIRTTGQQWCRVRYLYGDDVRVPECWGEFMYSNHLITGIDGNHYELWFSPSSLSYFKIRNQETNTWYAHDGSANDGRKRTTKDDWCRVIFYHMSGILERPDECKANVKNYVNAIAGTAGAQAQKDEVNIIREFMGKLVDDPEQKLASIAVDLKGSLGYDKLDVGGWSKGPLKGSKPSVKSVGSGMIVGVAVDYGVDKIKEAAGWTAKDANAGAIAAEKITTTVVSSSIATGIMMAAGASFNPVAFGVGLVVAGGFAAGEEIMKASKDTGIRLVPGYTYHPRYTRDLNGISVSTFAPMLLADTFKWTECATEGGRCNFSGTRLVQYGVGTELVEKAASGGIDCNTAAFGKDPKPYVQKRCYYPKYNSEK